MRSPIVLTAPSIWALAIALALAIAPAAQAQNVPDPDQVLVENRWAKVTRADYEAELLRLPANLRGGFATDPKRVIDLLLRMLVTKSLAVQARASESYKDADVQRRRAQELDRFDATVLISKIEEDAAKKFDGDKAKFEARARELYLVNVDAYRIPEQIAASHILFDFAKRSKDEAFKLALETRAKLGAGASFDAFARELSDDPTVKQNGGKLGYFDRTRMDPTFTEAAFALKNPGDVSDPVLTSFGYHLIRLDDRKPAKARSFDEAKAEILSEERNKYIAERRNELIANARADPTSRINQPAVDALVIKIDQNILDKALEASRPK
jgi:peptidyl-prolyl cis-trans isomerase C